MRPSRDRLGVLLIVAAICVAGTVAYAGGIYWQNYTPSRPGPFLELIAPYREELVVAVE